MSEQWECTIHYLVKEPFATIAEQNPRISKTHKYSGNIGQTISELKKEKFDLIIDLHKNIRSKRVIQSLKVKSISFNKVNFKKWLLIQTGVDLLPKMHLVDRYFKSLESLGIINDKKGSEIHIPESESEKIIGLGLPPKFITIGVGANHRGKSMSVDLIKHLLANLNYSIVLLGGSNDLDIKMGESVSKNQPERVTNLVGKTSILGSAEVIRLSSLLICGDTGVMHISSAVRTPSLSIWGCTSPSLGMYPYQPEPSSQILQPNGRVKRPCSKLGNKCKYHPELCIDSISHEDVVSAAVSILNKQSS